MTVSTVVYARGRKGRIACCTDLTVIGELSQTAFMTSSSSGVKTKDLFRDRTGSTIFKKFQHLRRTTFGWGVRWNSADTKLDTATEKLDFDGITDSHLAPGACLTTIHGNASCVAH